MSGSQDRCRLCPTTSVSVDSKMVMCFDANPSTGQAVYLTKAGTNNVADVLNHLFGFKLNQEHDAMAFVCKPCWQKVDEFHQFYQSVMAMYESQQDDLDDFFDELDSEDKNEMFDSAEPTIDDGYTGNVVFVNNGHEPGESLTESTSDAGKCFEYDDDFCWPEDAELAINDRNDQAANDARDSAEEHEEAAEAHLPKDIPFQVRTRFCLECKQVFPGYEALKQHCFEEHGTSQPRIECDECGKWYKTAAIMRLHKSTHRKEQWVCEECGHIAKSKARLSDHRFRMHRGWRHECPVCGLMLQSPNGLRDHIASLHERRLLHQCPNCPRSFATNKKLYYHRTKYHVEEVSTARRELAEHTAAEAKRNKTEYDAVISSIINTKAK